MCVASSTGLGSDSCDESSVVNINIFYPLDRLSTMVEVFSSNPKVCHCSSHGCTMNVILFCVCRDVVVHDLLFLQEAADDLSSVAALLNAMGRMPVNVGHEQGLSVMNFILISFWSHIAKFFCSP